MSLNAEAQANEKERTATGERLLGRDAASLFAPDLSLVRGDPVQTAELLFAAGNRAREVLSTPSARAAFVSALILGCKLTDADLFPVFDGTKARVLYARAGAADRAYRLFSEILPDPRVGYADSNVEAAEGVEAGDADLLLLPLYPIETFAFSAGILV